MLKQTCPISIPEHLADKSGITLETLVDAIKKCEMPSSKVHIIIQR